MNSFKLKYKLEKVVGVGRDFSWELTTKEERLIVCCICKKENLDEGFFCKRKSEMYCLDCEKGERSDGESGSSYRSYCSNAKEQEEHYRVIILYEGDPIV